MSTYLYIECTDHDPPLISRREAGQHLRNIPDVLKEIRTREPRTAGETFESLEELSLDKLYRKYPPELSIDAYFSWNIATFMLEHPYCSLVVRDEYGKKYTDDYPEGTWND